MQVLSNRKPLPVYKLEPDDQASLPDFRVYQYRGNLPQQSELLVPHRKDHYLVVLVRQAGNRQWVDTNSFVLEDNTMYFYNPSQVIVKEEARQLWSTGIAFTKEFLALQENAALSQLPLIQNPHNAYKLQLTEADLSFIEDILARIDAEYQEKGDWQQRMLGAYLTVLLTYLSRLYVSQYQDEKASDDKLLLKRFQAKVDECFHTLHEVSDYANLLHISAGHLSEVVKLQSGKPAIKHIHDRLVMEARRLLFHTQQPLKEIAFDLGFTDASYFSRFFKRETGTTPADYRDSIRKMYQ